MTEQTSTGRTAKGDRIAKYIRVHQLEDAGRGFAVMGAYVSPADGHAYESRCHIGCPKDCTAHVPRVVDHGPVTEPGPVARVERSRARFYRFGF